MALRRTAKSRRHLLPASRYGVLRLSAPTTFDSDSLHRQARPHSLLDALGRYARCGRRGRRRPTLAAVAARQPQAKMTTYFERRWPDSPAFQAIAEGWCKDHSRMLLDLVWRSIDRLLAQDLNVVPLSESDEDKERSLNFLLYLRVSECLSGYEPFRIVHEPPEQTKRRGRGARPPQPDLGFVLNNYPRAVWPLEAKVLSNDRAVGPYLAEIQNNFITCRYATFSGEGAMVGYLLYGDPERTFAAIATALALPVVPHPHFPDRTQKMSRHQRTEVSLPNSPREFICHHVVLRIPVATSSP